MPRVIGTMTAGALTLRSKTWTGTPSSSFFENHAMPSITKLLLLPLLQSTVVFLTGKKMSLAAARTMLNR